MQFKKLCLILVASALLLPCLVIGINAIGETSNGVIVDYAYTDSSKKEMVLDAEGNPCLTVIGYTGSERNVTIPAKVEMETKGEFLKVVSISKNAFKENKNLVRVTIEDGIETLSDGCFENCTELISVKLPSNLTIIPKNAFRGCTILSDITLPDGIEAIFDGAFSGCKLLEKLSLPEGLLYIGVDVFENCEGLILDVSKTQVGREYAEENSIITEYDNSSQAARDKIIIISVILLAVAAVVFIIVRRASVARAKKVKIQAREHKEKKQ